ncbi:sulfur oxidation c-type cytochrome SoxX [Rubellimicrobium roseum]|uniref:Sulfur oxidation c-type cytochrome SoxX n=1 Tax=Rubellimicrobium roseum TaxID=687525 RepID=A0A5C4N951_9RHOB|nr:sulfur oxidation c-type cytochrome SoxX [Rubellimicrobium roseum]TNC71341.1 sulfur oxidation c-type cytochrome SoxX [Rubellimicrobium roseum]
MRRLALAPALALAFAVPAMAQGLPEPLTAAPGDPARGRALVLDQQRSLCTLCHAGLVPQVPFPGDLGPDLTGVGDRLTLPELRLRLVDSRAVNPDTIMPPFHSLDGLSRVGARWQGATILSAQEVENVAAFLATLKGGSE